MVTSSSIPFVVVSVSKRLVRPLLKVCEVYHRPYEKYSNSPTANDKPALPYTMLSPPLEKTIVYPRKNLRSVGFEMMVLNVWPTCKPPLGKARPARATSPFGCPG